MNTAQKLHAKSISVMDNPVAPDRSNGYERVAKEYVARRTDSSIGVATVREWAKTLPKNATVLDLGCGNGAPISAALTAEGATVYGVDASPTLAAAFRARFPDAPIDCSAVEDSEFFGRRFDAVVAWGLMFLLTPDNQARLITKVSAALNPGGWFLFTSPEEPCEWLDNLTGQQSISLGSDEYRRLLKAAGLLVAGYAEDEGQNFYYFARKLNGDERAA